MNIPTEGNSYQYYAYSNSVVRVEESAKVTEVKNHESNAWTKVEAPEFLRRVQEHGMSLKSREDAEGFYQVLRSKLKKNVSV